MGSQDLVIPDDYPKRLKRFLDRTDRFQLDTLLTVHGGHWANGAKSWNERQTPYNPSGRRFKKKELGLMAMQETFDHVVPHGFELATTADQLLARAEEVRTAMKPLL